MINHWILIAAFGNMIGKSLQIHGPEVVGHRSFGPKKFVATRTD